MGQLRVGLLGCGVVGSSVVRGLQDLPAHQAPELRRVAVRALGKRRDVEVADLLTDDPWAVVEDPDVDVIVEVMGGVVPTVGLIARALELGKPVVTANKRALGVSGPELRAMASRSRTPLLFEAAVGGAVPLVRGFAGLARADEILKVQGVLNGTSTFVLSHVEETGATIEDAVAEARRLGFAEEDASRDLDGSDAADKLAVLAQYLFDEPLRTEDVHRFGIDALTTDDIAGDGTRRWRLLATAVRGQCARVEPVPLRLDHPFATLRGAQNAVTITGRRCGEITLTGLGAGGEATACAVIGDLLSAQDWVAAERRPAWPSELAAPREGAPERDLVGVFQVATHGQPGGDA